MRLESREALELFVEKADKLKNSGLTQSAQQMEFQLSWNRDDQILRSRTKGPTIEEVDAFVLTFRLFTQKNDHCSFRWLASHVLDDPDVSDHWKKQYSEAQEDLNRYLGEYPAVKLLLDKEPQLTRREIMDIFIYGDLAHAARERREAFKKRMSHEILSKLYRIEFSQILLVISNQIIVFVASLSESELKGKL